MVELFTLYRAASLIVRVVVPFLAVVLFVSESVLRHAPEVACPSEKAIGFLGLVLLVPITSFFILAPDVIASVADIAVHSLVSGTGIVIAVICIYKAREREVGIPMDFEKELSPRKARRYACQYLRNAGLDGPTIEIWCKETFTTRTKQERVASLCSDLITGNIHIPDTQTNATTISNGGGT